MYKKQKLLLGLIQLLSDKNSLSKLHLTKIMFLLSKENNLKYSHYHFHPYNYGPFSYKMYSDINYLEKKGFLIQDNNKNNDHIKLTKTGKEEGLISIKEMSYVNSILKNYDSIEKIIDYVYEKYPEYTCKSKRKNIPIEYKLESNPNIFLIGYEGKDIDEFVHDLVINNIDILVDVRFNPRSMKYMFNKKRLENVLKMSKIGYINIKELGIPNDMRKKLDSKEDYDKLFKIYWKNLPSKEKYIDMVEDLGKKKRIALMCFEKDINYCHRGQIGKYLELKRGLEITSI